MIERKIVSNVYGEEVVIPLSESEYQSIKWDWQIAVDEIEAEADSISRFADSKYMLETMSLMATDEDLDRAEAAYNDRREQALRLYEKADKIRNANPREHKAN
jgi:ribonuclease HI